MARRDRWPTATTLDHIIKRTTMGGGPNNPTLQGAVGGLNPKDVERWNRNWSDGTTQPSLTAQAKTRDPTGALSPDWVELLMGFPRGYTKAPTPSDGSKG
jgi:hypothetical protein